MNKSENLGRGLLALFLCSMITLAGFVNMDRVVADDGERIDQYTTRITDKNGNVVYREVVPGSPPPAVLPDAVGVPMANTGAGTNTLTNVPTSTWAYGCSATAAAMLAGYYDQPARGYTNIYTGPTNGGVSPLNNTFWGSASYPATCGSATTCGNNPLAATKNGVDGRTTSGYADDYWQALDCSGDPYTTGSWTPHADDCTGDFMGTSQWTKDGNPYNSYDGSTWFYYGSNNTPLYDYVDAEPAIRDGCHGIKLFLQSRGYTVTSNYSQRIYGYNGISAGFTYTQFKAEIDSGRPVIIQIYGHTMLGIGYSDPGTIYIHDTWSNSSTSMDWGGTYSGKQHRGVTVIQLAALPTTPTINNTAGASSIMATTAILNGNLTYTGGLDTTVIIYGGTSDNGTPSSPPGGWTRVENLGVKPEGAFSLGVTGLTPDTTYYYRCYAENSEDRSWAMSTSSFTTQADLGLWRNYWAGPGIDWFWFSSVNP